MGCLMKNVIATQSLPDEHYVIRIDGRVKSHHRRFVDALRAGLQLKDQFPQHDIKVRAMQASGDRELAFALTRLRTCGSLGSRASLNCAAFGGG
jgi:hypothetical protein